MLLRVRKMPAFSLSEAKAPFIRTKKLTNFDKRFVDFFYKKHKKVGSTLLTKQKSMIYCGKQTNPSGFVCLLYFRVYDIMGLLSEIAEKLLK